MDPFGAESGPLPLSTLEGRPKRVAVEGEDQLGQDHQEKGSGHRGRTLRLGFFWDNPAAAAAAAAVGEGDGGDFVGKGHFEGDIPTV